MNEDLVKGWGFVNDKLEILCIKKTLEGTKYLDLVPWREADPKEVIILWEPKIDTLISILLTTPFMEMIKLDKETISLSELEPMHVEKDKDTIWIG